MFAFNFDPNTQTISISKQQIQISNIQHMSILMQKNINNCIIIESTRLCLKYLIMKWYTFNDISKSSELKMQNYMIIRNGRYSSCQSIPKKIRVLHNFLINEMLYDMHCDNVDLYIDKYRNTFANETLWLSHVHFVMISFTLWSKNHSKVKKYPGKYPSIQPPPPSPSTN